MVTKAEIVLDIGHGCVIMVVEIGEAATMAGCDGL
jgi:hypothetical protein|tara:strand:- start:193 stop:297 length:105 start_codon:yes stop_codon:yes gene_type:complete